MLKQIWSAFALFLTHLLFETFKLISRVGIIPFDASTGVVGYAKFAVTNTPESMVGDFKNLYKSSGLVDAIPKWMIVQDRFAFEEAEAGLGQYYIFGVILQKEHGFTYAPSSGSSSGAQTLNASVAGYIGQAQVEGFAIYARGRLSYDAAAKASRAGKKAFAQAYGAVLKNMKESHQYRLECSLLYGRDGLGKVSSIDTGVITITSATWATGIWAAGMSGAILEAFTGTGASVSQHNGDLTISAVSVSAKTVTVTGTSSAVVADDILYFKGARTTTAYKECPGLFRILSTTSGDLFNISTTTYELWRSQLYTVSGNLSLTAIMQGAARGIPFGLEKALLMCAPVKFAQLASDEAALRRYVQDTPQAKRGVKGISFMLGSVDVEILPHPLVREGHALLLPEQHVHRVGSTDVTFGLPGSGEPMQVHVTDTTALEIRSMSDQGIYIEVPAQAVLLDSIT
jgi:hypothetical protein